MIDHLFTDSNGYHSPKFKLFMWVSVVLLETATWIVDNPYFKVVSGLSGLALIICGIASYIVKIRADIQIYIKNKRDNDNYLTDKK